ncbi:hypothetical protein Q4567_00255 [Aliiglaciecola sp. 2_MG-2023]|uniref:hypothetical protein n=1 Tax=unclassified Aliiglaciecola TaxID=2593648 RepID=UPI0026E40FCA|nr:MULTISPECIES: hypothetical protein [unclassified Aliiglaciecola]MDO6709139.1 hypothetical protein [Aliiglaciecola sp. 2_MG-2023]MDO6750287.1 hypothetical protein [Aliiglaciecola sp. 1_MG-2023]
MQNALNKNRDLLLQNGIDYPEHEVGPNGISSGNLNAILTLDKDSKWAVCADKVANIVSQFEMSKAHTLLLSSEYFFYLTQEIAQIIPSAKFIAYIRCPLETFESSYNQSVKRHMRTTPIVFGKNLHLTTLNLLSEAIDVIGRKRFILRAYLSSFEQNFDLIEDFGVAASLPALKSSQRFTNSSYTFEALEFKRWLNQFGLKELDGLIDQALQAYDGGLKQFSMLPEDLFSRYQKQSLHSTRDFIQNYKVSNGKALVTFLKNRESMQHMEQNLNENQLNKVCQYFIEHYPQLFDNICDALKQHSKSDIEHVERVALILQKQKAKPSIFQRIFPAFIKK